MSVKLEGPDLPEEPFDPEPYEHLLAVDPPHWLFRTPTVFTTDALHSYFPFLPLQGMNFDNMWSVKHDHTDLMFVPPLKFSSF